MFGQSFGDGSANAARGARDDRDTAGQVEQTGQGFLPAPDASVDDCTVRRADARGDEREAQISPTAIVTGELAKLTLGGAATSPRPPAVILARRSSRTLPEKREAMTSTEPDQVLTRERPPGGWARFIEVHDAGPSPARRWSGFSTMAEGGPD
jgi:hypothetical protein